MMRDQHARMQYNLAPFTAILEEFEKMERAARRDLWLMGGLCVAIATVLLLD